MAVQGLENLSVLRITKIVEALQDQRMKQPTRLKYSGRLRRVNAVNGEMMARFVGRILIADLIAPDSVAGVYSSGKMAFESTQIPKIKIGRQFTESQLEQLEQIRNGQVQGESAIFDFIAPVVNNCLTGIEHRCEALAVAMWRDRLDYERLGYQAAGVTWGMPSDLKITPSVPWTTAASATPCDDLLAAQQLARVKYGINYNRADMSTEALRLAVATTEFANKAKPFVRGDLSIPTNYSSYSLSAQRQLFEAITGITIDLSDDRYWFQNTDGSIASARFQPINEVYLSDSANDGNTGIWDMAVGIVVETMLLGMNPASVVGAGSIGGGRRGPVGYMTYPSDLNPPNVTLWGVDSAFPRKHLMQANAVLTVGHFTDSIPVADIAL